MATWLLTAIDPAERMYRGHGGYGICELLSLSEAEALSCRYQLLHRPVAAVLEARRFRLSNALFIVHAVGENESSLEDYRHWAGLLGVDAASGSIVSVGSRGGVCLWIGWLAAPVSAEPQLEAAI